MKILYASLRPFFPLRFAHGGQKTTHDLLFAINTIGGYKCEAIFYCKPEYLATYLPQPSEWDELGIQSIEARERGIQFDCGYPIYGVTVSGELFWDALENACNSFEPDIILTGQRNAIEIVKFSRNKNLPVLWNIDTSPGQGVYEISDLIIGSKLGAKFICCSKYVEQQITLHSLGKINSKVVYPLIDPMRYMLNNYVPNYLTIINPVKVKGGDLIEGLAMEIPEEQFLLVKGWELDPSDSYWFDLEVRMKNYSNVHISPRTSDMRKIYEKTKLLLVPSQWDEAFGRIIREAQCNSIPCIVSAVGGIPEALGNGGILIKDYQSVQAWVHCIREILGEPNKIQELRDAAHYNSNRRDLAVETVIESFTLTLKEALDPL